MKQWKRNGTTESQRRNAERHRDLNPNDLGKCRTSLDNTGVMWSTWGTKRDRHLEDFYKTNDSKRTPRTPLEALQAATNDIIFAINRGEEE